MRKGKFSKSVINKELWKEFKELYPEYGKMSNQDLNKVWGDIAEVLRIETITNPLGVKLASYTGELKFQYLPYKFEAIAQSESEEAGGSIRHLNVVQKGKVGKIKWERRWAVKFNKILQFYAFEATREMSKLAKQHVSANPEKLRMSRNTLGGQHSWRDKNGK
jgi:hypothetical protein